MKKIQYYPLIDMANQHLFDEGGITSSNGMYYVNPSDYQSILDAQSNNQPVNVTLPDVIVKAVDPKNYRSAFHPEDISTVTDVMMGPFKLFLTNPFKLTQSIINKDYSTTGEEVLKTILPMENVLGHTANFALGVDQLLNENGVRKTYNHLKKGEYGRAALSGLGDIFNAAMTGLGAKGLYGDLQNGYTKFMEGEVPQWLRNTSLWHNATAEHRAKRALDTSEELRHQFINNYKTEDRAANFALPALKEKIVIKSGKNTPNPINVEKMTPKAVKETWDKIASNQWYGRPEIVIKDIDGKPTAVSYVGGYSPTQMINGRPRVTTGKYSIPDFATGDIVNGDLQIKGGSTESLITQYGDIINNEGVPREVTGLTPLQEVLRDNYNYVQKDLPGFRGFGSSIGVMDGSLSHITHDIDGFMTKEAYDAARKVHPDITTPDSRGLASYFVKPEQYGNDINGANHIDINVIDVNPTTGLGNSRATELYRQFFPREYRQSVINVAKRSNDTSQIPIVHLDGTPFTNQELLEAYDPLRKTIMDSMESSKGKHIGRMMEYLAGPNPDAVHDAIQATADEIAQVDKGFTLPKLKLGTPKENAAILKKIGFNGDIATVAADPKKMQNTLDLWYMGEGGYFSRTASAGDRGETGGTINKLFRNFTDWNEKTDSSSNGHGAGAFLNAVFGNTHSVIGNSVYGVYHPKLQGIKEGITPDELISTVRRQNGWSTEKVTKEDLTKIVKALRDNNLNTAADNIENTFKSGKDVTFNDLLNTLPNYGSEVKNAGKQIHAETGINAIGGEPYNNEVRYAGLIGSFDPNTDIGFFGRDNFEGWPSWSERNISEVASDSNPFKAMKEHTTYDEGESFMRSPNYVDISKEQFDKYFDMIHRDDLKNYAFRYILRQHPELQGKVTIDEVMKLPEFREYILKFNTPELRKTSATDMFGFSQDASSKTGYQVNLKELRSTIRNNKRKEHNRKATDWSKKALVEEQRNNRIYTKMKSIDENKSSIKKGAVYAGIAGAVSTGSYGLYSNYKKSEEDSALFKKWLETSEGQDYSSKLIELHRNKASDEELEKLYNDKDRAFEKFKVLMNIKNHTHAKGGFLGNTLPEVEVVAKYPHEQRVIDTMNASNAEFMQRLRNNDFRAIHNADGSYSTHVLGNADNMVFPAIQNVNGVLEDYRSLPWQRTLDKAIQNKDYIEFPTEGDARYFGEHYKKYFPEFFSHFGDNQYAEGGPKGRRGITPTRTPIGGNRFRLPDADEETDWSPEEIAEYNRKLEEKNAEIARQDAERRARDLEEARRNGTLKRTSFDKTLEAIGKAVRKMHRSAMKSHSFDRLRRAQNSLSQGVNTEIATAKGIANASQQYANEQMEKKQQQMHDIKKGFDATATALEMGAAGYTIGHLTVPRLIHTNTGWLSKVSDFFTNSNAQLGANAIGSLADGYQLLTADNKFDRYENGIELGGDTAGIVGGLDIVRNSNIFGRYSKPIDKALDTIGLSAATWDIAKNMPPFSYYYGKLKDYVNGTNDTEDNQYAKGGEMDTPKHWNELSMADKSDAIASAVRNGVTTLEDIRKAWDDYADSGYREDSSYRDNSEDMGNTLDDYDDTYQEETHEYLKGGYKPSAAIKNRIANWEGSSMQTNRSFEAEAKDFWNAIPSNVRNKLSQQQADALYSYSYNVGAGNFKRRVVPSLERYFNGNGSVEDVQRHMYATKDKDYRGLAKRRAVERAMFGGQRVEDVSSFDYDYSSNSSPYGHRFTVNNNFQTAGYLGPIVNGNSVNNDNTNKTNIFLQALEDEPKQTIAESTPEPAYNTLERLQNMYSMYGMDDYAQEIGKYNPFEGLMFAEGGKKSTDTKGVTSSNGSYHVNPADYWAVLGSVKNNRPVEVTLPDVTVKAADPKNYRSSYDPNGFMDFMNAVTLGVGNRFSVSQDARLLKDTYDAISGNKSWKDVFNSAVFGNNGIFDNPYANMALDIVVPTVGGNYRNTANSGKKNKYSFMDKLKMSMMNTIPLIPDPTTFNAPFDNVTGNVNDRTSSVAQVSYLLSRDKQQKLFEDYGYKRVYNDYGTVKRAAESKGYPIYQKNSDDASRENLVPIGNANSDPFEVETTYKGKLMEVPTNWYAAPNKSLIEAGATRSTIYYNPDNGKYYQKAWDLNDYGGNGGSTAGIFGKFLDTIGNPVVVTSGIQEVLPKNINKVEKNYMLPYAKKHYLKKADNGHLGYVAPEVIVTGHKHAGG